MSHPVLRRCPNCSAPVPSRAALTCAFCGSPVATAEPEPATPAAAVAPPTVQERLALLRRDPRFAQACRRAPDRSFALGRLASDFLGGGVLGAFSFVLLTRMQGAGQGGMPFLFWVVPGIATFLLVQGTRRALRYAGLPTSVSAAAVIGERTETRRSRRSHRTDYYATFEFEGGARLELRVPGRVAGELAQGDVGVLWNRGEWFLEFERIALR